MRWKVCNLLAWFLFVRFSRSYTVQTRHATPKMIRCIALQKSISTDHKSDTDGGDRAKDIRDRKGESISCVIDPSDGGPMLRTRVGWLLAIVFTPTPFRRGKGREGKHRGHSCERRDTEIQVDPDVVAWMEFRLIQAMPDEKEDEPYHVQEHPAQGELLTEVAV